MNDQDMNKERLEHLWKVLSSATQIDKLDYGEAVTIGSVFGEMKNAILHQQTRIQELETIEKAYEALKKAL